MNTPIYNSVKKYWQSSPISFHMPGHKLGKGLMREFAENMALCDLTEIPGLDVLHYPDGIIKDAQELAAKAFSADKTFFLVNGSTSGIQTLILTLCKPGDKLIVSRDCHRSVIYGMFMAGVTPVYVKPRFNSKFGISSVILPQDIEHAIKENPDAVGVLITRPNYYGICSDLFNISQIVHSYGKVLAVDEAHGAHLGFNSRVPQSAMQLGADICVQSAHKTLPALTQGAYLHVKSHRIDIDRLLFYFRMLQTTSPSYIIMSSLDIARAVMEEKGEKLLDELLSHIRGFEELILGNTSLKLLSENHIHGGKVDRTRLVINVSSLGETGFHIGKILREEYRLLVEMADLYNLVCIATVSDGKEDFANLSKAVDEISSKFKKASDKADIYVEELEIPEQKIAFKDLIGAKGKWTGLKDSIGKVSLGMVVPYPPGIPVLCPGEVISRNIAQYLNRIIASGGMVNGLSSLKEIEVIEL